MDLPFWAWLGIGAAAVLLALLALFFWVKGMVRKEPYRSFMQLRNMAKLRFFKSVMTDRRVPLGVKLIPVLTVLYLTMPFDLLPDFIPVLGYMDDVGIVVLALSGVVALSPRPVIEELLRDAASA